MRVAWSGSVGLAAAAAAVVGAGAAARRRGGWAAAAAAAAPPLGAAVAAGRRVPAPPSASPPAADYTPPTRRPAILSNSSNPYASKRPNSSPLRSKKRAAVAKSAQRARNHQCRHVDHHQHDRQRRHDLKPPRLAVAEQRNRQQFGARPDEQNCRAHRARKANKEQQERARERLACSSGTMICMKVYCQLAPCTRELSSSSRPNWTIDPGHHAHAKRQARRQQHDDQQYQRAVQRHGQGDVRPQHAQPGDDARNRPRQPADDVQRRRAMNCVRVMM